MKPHFKSFDEFTISHPSRSDLESFVTKFKLYPNDDTCRQYISLLELMLHEYRNFVNDQLEELDDENPTE
jgi:hypothetical protein